MADIASLNIAALHATALQSSLPADLTPPPKRRWPPACIPPASHARKRSPHNSPPNQPQQHPA
ncbi:hypothetical protein ACD582_11670, partial [Xanthomonas nasturtii]|uniref:hypothetical protein n=1 Tax=Xanthomonas nasturtii TaxID=1843581 RepID=UPI003558732B